MSWRDTYQPGGVALGESEKGMKKYTFSNGDVMTSELSAEELMKRLRRLDTLRVMVEQNDCKEGRSICKKALRAYDKMNNFTGIIRLTFLEKDWLSYKLEDDFLDDEDREVIEFYSK